MPNFQINEQVKYYGSMAEHHGQIVTVRDVKPANYPYNVLVRFADGVRIWCDPVSLHKVVPLASSDGQAFKADEGKPNWYLLMSAKGCAKALAGVVRVLSFAVAPKPAGKGYTAHSWREVPNAAERYQAALYRHLNKIEMGEEADDESGESHWYHVATNALFLAELHNKDKPQ